MKKEIQTVLLVLIFSVSAAARLSILGWLFFVGIGSVLILGVVHFIIHFYSMNYLEKTRKHSILKIMLSHFLFLCMFLFQIDADDSRSYSVLGYILRIRNNFLESSGMTIVLIGLIFYIILSTIIVIEARREKLKGNNIRLILPAILISLFLPFLLVNLIYANIKSQNTNQHEKTGSFSSVERALRDPEKVTVFEVNPYETHLSEFPIEILKLPNLKEINLSKQNITEIPTQIYQLQKLESLNLLDNNIHEINPSICQCKNLRELRIGGDMMTLPACLKEMKSLEHLSIQSNYANKLMDELRSFKNLKTAHFYLKQGIFDNEKWEKIEKETGITHKY